MKQINLATRAKISAAHLSYILSGKRRPSWRVAKRLANATRTKPALWMEGTVADIRAALEQRVNGQRVR